MKIFKKINELTAELDFLRDEKKTIGFVPTMGALHQGHLSLINTCTDENNVTVVSIFVNPTQFNNTEDLRNYPRLLEKDLSLLKETKTDILFLPDNNEMYPEKDERVFKFDNLDNVLEGAFRPGHFNGVAQIVSKFFEIIKPDSAYFGEKDFQQLAIINRLVKMLELDVNIVSCKTLREYDGLAMSSRNLLLTNEYRQAAPKIFKYLKESTLKTQYNTVEEVKKYVVDNINDDSLLRVEYFDIVDAETFMPITIWNKSVSIVGCIAVFAGNIRLIDNIRYN